MSPSLFRAWPLLALFLAGEVVALGLGDIRLDSALNEPLRAEIELVSPTEEELQGLRVQLASSDSFQRYGLDRPLFLASLQFEVVPRGRAGGVVRVTSRQPITEPFVTFLVEASWPRGRLLREYTVLLDPPTFAPPPSSAEAPPAVTAPTRDAEEDRGRIERPAAPSRPAPRPAPRPAAEPPPAGTGDFDTTPGGEVRVQRGDTLWGIASRERPDDRLSMNQTMLAIYEANPQAFGGNINRLNAGALLTIPSADDIFRISRGAAWDEVQRQNAAAGIAEAEPRPSLTLVPPDQEAEEPAAAATPRPAASPAPAGQDSAAMEQRLRSLEDTVTEQRSLIEIRDNEIATLREELARLRQEQAAARDEAAGVAAEDDVFTGEAAEDDVAADEPAAAAPPATAAADAADEPGFVGRVMDGLSGIWGLVILLLLAAVAVLLWFARKAASQDDDSTGMWEALDADDEEMDSESRASTERLRALAREDDSSIVVVEQDSGAEERRRATPAAAAGASEHTAETAALPDIEDTFSSETAANLDKTDPVAEADFHMAYGLYDQAADLVNGALAVEPAREDLMAKLCEIYFVWGNRDGFVEAATRFHDHLGNEASPEWDKVVIMGQQIAPDHELFSGVSTTAASRAVDLSFGDDDTGQTGSLDMTLDADRDDVMSTSATGLDFEFDAEPDSMETGETRAMPEEADADATAESPTVDAPAPMAAEDESPTAEQQFDGLEGTFELPSAGETGERGGDVTEEIDLDDLGLDLEGLADADDLDDAEPGIEEMLDPEATSETGALDEEATGRHAEIDDESGATGLRQAPNFADLDSTAEMPLDDEVRAEDETDLDVDLDASLLEATAETQLLRDDAGEDAAIELRDEDDTQTGDEEFAFAETSALDDDIMSAGSDDDTGEMPRPAGSTDVDLDLDDLTAALKFSEGDTVDQPRDDTTIERPLEGEGGLDLDVGAAMDEEDDRAPTAAMPADEGDEDLNEARTMTEVGTKLDLARAYVDMGDPDGARSILEEVLDEGDEGQRQQAQKLIDSLPG